jgi:List-Bact-rpt repeat protein
VSFHRMSLTDLQIASNGAYVRDVVERELNASGFSAPGKIYAVYYDGTSTYACGGGAWPPTLRGNVGALYLKARFGASFLCYTPAASRAGLQVMDLAILHEVMHTLGFVPTCAPHHTRAGHVSDSPTDLMYAGNEQWRPSVLDLGHDDYYGAHIASCPDLADSPYLEGATVTLTIAINAQGGSGSVSSNPPGIACPPTCAAQVPQGSVVTLTATPAANARFLGWGRTCSGTGQCTVTLTAARSVSAVFGTLRHRLTVLLKGKGRVTSAPPGLACVRRCSAMFDSGTRAALRAAPGRGWRFRGWTGACTGRGACSVLMSRDRMAVATFSHR